MSQVTLRPISQHVESANPAVSTIRLARTTNSSTAAARGTQSMDPSAALRSPPQQPRSAFSDLLAGVQQVRDLLNIVQGVQQSRPAGVGLMQGARQFSQEVSFFLNALQSLGQAYSQGGSAALEQQVLQIGAGAQSALLANLKAEALAEVSQVLGLDPASASIGDIAEAAYGYITGTQAAGIEGAAAVADGAGAAAEGAAGLSGTVNQVIGAAGAAYSLYNIINNFGELSLKDGIVNGAATGAYVGSFFGPPGTLIGGAIGGVVGAVASFFKKSGKSKEQKARDKVRDAFEQIGLIDENHSVTLADGTKYDIGKDGKHKYTNLDGTKRGAFEIDFSNPMSGQVIGWINPIVEQLVGGDEKLRIAFVGYFTNAALSNAKSLEEARQNVLAMFKNIGLTPEKIASGLQQMNAAGKLPNDVFEAYVNGVITLYQPASEEPMDVAVTSPKELGAEPVPPPALPEESQVAA